MTESQVPSPTSTKVLAKVAKVLDENRIVINLGSTDGIRRGESFLVYEIGEEIFDPDTKESLGRIQITKGRGTIVHVQERLAILESSERKEIQRRYGGIGILASAMGAVDITKEREPFIDPKVGDVVVKIG